MSLSVFLIDRIDPRHHAQERWREAEQLVSARWDAFLKAELETRCGRRVKTRPPAPLEN